MLSKTTPCGRGPYSGLSFCSGQEDTAWWFEMIQVENARSSHNWIVRFSTSQQSETGDSVPIQYWPSGRGAGPFQVTCRLLTAAAAAAAAATLLTATQLTELVYIIALWCVSVSLYWAGLRWTVARSVQRWPAHSGSVVWHQPPVCRDYIVEMCVVSVSPPRCQPLRQRYIRLD